MKIIADEYNEKSIIATALLSKVYLSEILTLREDDFYYEKFRLPYRAIKNLVDNGDEVGLTSVYNKLIEFDKRTEAENFIKEFINVGVSYDIISIIKNVKELADKRRLDLMLADMRTKLNQDGANANEIAFSIINQIQEIENRTVSAVAQYGDNGLGCGRFQQCLMPTNFDPLDNVLHGMTATQVIILAARPGVGKSAFAEQLASLIADEGRRILFINLEMEIDDMELRLICARAKLNMSRIRSGDLTEQEIERFYNAEQEILKYDDRFLMVDNVFELNEIKNLVRREHMKKPIDLVVIDYLQLIEVTGEKGRRHEQVATISRQLKLLAKELRIPHLVLSQLNREGEGEEPKLSNLRESGAIEQDANAVIFLHPEPESSSGVMNLIVAKNRQGITGKTKIRFMGEFQTFTSIDKMYVDNFADAERIE